MTLSDRVICALRPRANRVLHQGNLCALRACVTLPLALADPELFDEYELLVQPVHAGHGLKLLVGLRERIQLQLVHRHEFRLGDVALRHRPTRAPS